jgi:hypothetical protein
VKSEERREKSEEIRVTGDEGRGTREKRRVKSEEIRVTGDERRETREREE